MRRPWYTSPILEAILLLIGIGLLTSVMGGCANDGAAPTGPAAPASAGSSSSGGPTFLIDPAPRVAAPLEEVQVSRTIDARTGASLTAGNVTVTIDAGAVASPTVVTLTLTDAEHLRFQLGPVGATLLRPVRLSVTDLDETDGQYARNLRFFRVTSTGHAAVSTSRYGTEMYGWADRFGEFVVGTLDPTTGRLQLIRWLEGDGYQTELIRAWYGGVVQYGRYKVTVPPGALSKDTYITVRHPIDEHVVCELEPHGIQFLVPVELEIDLNGTPFAPYTDWTIWWYDPSTSTARWVNQGGGFNDGKVRAYLQHFSEYAPGRGGW